MEALFGLLFQVLLFVLPLVVFGLIFGRMSEKKHFRELDEREAATQDMLVTQLKSYPLSDEMSPPRLVMSEVVIASDYLKSFFSKWRNVFGGEMKSFRLMQDRAKREAILRLVEQAKSHGYNAICNVRLNGADIGGNTAGSKGKVPMAAVIATATAYNTTAAGPPPSHHIAELV